MSTSFEECCALMEKRILYFMAGKSLGISATLRIHSSSRFYVQKGSIVHQPKKTQKLELQKLFDTLKMNNVMEQIAENSSLFKLLEDVPFKTTYYAACFVLGRSPLSSDYEPWSLIKDVPLIQNQVFEELSTKFDLHRGVPMMLRYYFMRLSGTCMINFIFELKNSCRTDDEACLQLLRYLELYDEYFDDIPFMLRYISSGQSNQYAKIMKEMSLLYFSFPMREVFLNLKNRAKQREIFDKLYSFQKKKKEYVVVEYLFVQYNELKQMDTKDYNDDSEVCDETNNLNDNPEKQKSWLDTIVSSISHLFQLEKHQYHLTLDNKIK